MALFGFEAEVEYRVFASRFENFEYSHMAKRGAFSVHLITGLPGTPEGTTQVYVPTHRRGTTTTAALMHLGGVFMPLRVPCTKPPEKELIIANTWTLGLAQPL